MVRKLFLLIALVGSPVLAADHSTPDARLQKILANRVAGRPTNCISLSGSQSSEIIEGKAIVYRVGGTIYVNEPRSGAASLHYDDILVTRTYGSELCSVDSVNLVDRASRFPRGFVILGKFVPYERVKPAPSR